MQVFADYNLALWGLLLTLLTVFVQSVIAAVSKARAPGAVPGKIDPGLSHESFVFRANRTVGNSLENLPVFLGIALVAILAGARPDWTAVWVWAYALARLVHMVLYYRIATEKNPSPRSYFFLLGVVATLALFVLVALTLR